MMLRLAEIHVGNVFLYEYADRNKDGCRCAKAIKCIKSVRSTHTQDQQDGYVLTFWKLWCMVFALISARFDETLFS